MARTIHERADLLPILVELFSRQGYAALTLTALEDRAGVGRGSLYHFFRNGKREMAVAALEHSRAKFRSAVLAPLRDADTVLTGLEQMLSALAREVAMGGCYLELLFALDGTREMFPEEVGSHYREWAIGLARLIGRAGYSRGRAWAIAEEIIGSIEGALVLARAMGDPRAFSRAIKRLRTRLQKISRRQMP